MNEYLLPNEAKEGQKGPWAEGKRALQSQLHRLHRSAACEEERQVMLTCMVL